MEKLILNLFQIVQVFFFANDYFVSIFLFSQKNIPIKSPIEFVFKTFGFLFG